MSEQATDPFNSLEPAPGGGTEWAWDLLRAAGAHARTAPGDETGGFTLDSGGQWRAVPSGQGAVLERRCGAWTPADTLPAGLRAMLDLYLPVCGGSPAAPLVVGHLGQSLDGYIATGSGDSNYVTGPANILHLHRMRALCDAVVVGAGTIAADDPRLTTRLADGANPVRVILDPRRRLPPAHRVFDDGAAPSLLVCNATLAAPGVRVGQAEVVGVPCRDDRLDLAAVVAALRARGLHRVFVEGGGTTVSRFLEAGFLDRLQIAIAPLVIGCGRPGLRLPSNERIAECLRPAHRIFAMGCDVLFDCQLRHGGNARSDTRDRLTRLC